MSRIVTIIMVTVLSGCASTPLTGPFYKHANRDFPNIQAGESRLTLYRPAVGRKLSRANAYIEIDGNSITTASYGSFVYVDVPTGKHLASVNAFGTSNCNVSFESFSGEELFFEIVPGSSVGTVWLMFGAVGVVVGSAVESSGEECGGEYAMKQVKRAYAIKRLKNLRLKEN